MNHHFRPFDRQKTVFLTGYLLRSSLCVKTGVHAAVFDRSYGSSYIKCVREPTERFASLLFDKLKGWE